MKKDYKSLFDNKKGFSFDGKWYTKSRSSSFYEWTQDVLDKKFGPLDDRILNGFGKIICLKYEDIPPSVIKRKSFKELGNIYINLNKSVDAFNTVIERVGKLMNKKVIIK